jgi:hypothetical protein
VKTKEFKKLQKKADKTFKGVEKSVDEFVSLFEAGLEVALIYLQDNKDQVSAAARVLVKSYKLTTPYVMKMVEEIMTDPELSKLGDEALDAMKALEPSSATKVKMIPAMMKFKLAKDRIEKLF